jgi:hypothetical protein
VGVYFAKRAGAGGAADGGLRAGEWCEHWSFLVSGTGGLQRQGIGCVVPGCGGKADRGPEAECVAGVGGGCGRGCAGDARRSGAAGRGNCLYPALSVCGGDEISSEI